MRCRNRVICTRRSPRSGAHGAHGAGACAGGTGASVGAGGVNKAVSGTVGAGAGALAGWAGALAAGACTAEATGAADTSGADSGIDSDASIRASTSPAFTSLPDGRQISASTPETGAATSRMTLSVSRSVSGSSRRTKSPGCLRHSSREPLWTDSDSSGALTSISMNDLDLCIAIGRIIGRKDRSRAA